MLKAKQVKEIREHLENAKNPLFLFDNDQDGLCSFLLLQRFLGRGKGFPVTSFPDLDKNYFRKVEELKADYIFILDKPVVSEEFWKEVRQYNIPVVWIDHHMVQGDVPDFVNYYNVALNKPKTTEPVTALCYQITQKKDDLWLAVVGSVSDKFVPDFYDDFEKEFPELSCKYKDAFDIYYGSAIGKVAKIFGFGLKDTTTNVISMMKFLMKAKGPYDVLEENPKNSRMHERFSDVDKRYSKLFTRALECLEGNLLFFQYSGETSMSSNLANELSHRFPGKYIVVAYINGVKVNVSSRGEKVRDIFLKAIEGLEDARGGGHEKAVGGQVRADDLEKFKKRMAKAVK